MSVIVLLIGGVVGTFASIFALFGLGVSWSAGISIYFATAAIVALPMLAIGLRNQGKVLSAPTLSDWENELRDYQSGPLVPAPVTGSGDDTVPNQKAA